MNKLSSILIKFIWISFFCIVVGLGLFIYSVSIDAFGLFGGLPSLEVLEKPEPNLSSELISADGISLGKYYRKNRTPVTYADLSPDLVKTLLSTEDIRFNQHSGIDLRGLVRVFVYTIILNQDAGGGSTLTQQLAKNLFKTRTEQYEGKLSNFPFLNLVIIKVKEWIVSVILEQSYTKEEILAMYLNTVEFGSNSYGIKVASKTFFNKLPSELNYEESALLVGMINAPTRYSPILNPDNAKDKQKEVLHNTYKYGFIDQNLYDSLRNKPIELNYKVDNHNKGIATYFRKVVKNYLVYWTREHGYDLFEDGLKIYTTIDSKLQKYAEKSVREHMKIQQELFEEHWQDENPWIDEEGNEIEGFIENAIKRTEYYKYLVNKFGAGSDSVDFHLNKPKRMTVFSWKGEIDTTFSMIDSLKYYKRFLQAGFMAMEPTTGQIKAWVGGINHKYFKYDHVMQSKRQPGSTFKPIVYATAIDHGFSPCYPVPDASVTFSMPGQDPPTWTPENCCGPPSGEIMTIRQAMARSVNSITAFMMKKLGPETVVKYAERLGIRSNLEPVPSLSLGSAGEVSIYEMVSVYSTFVNKGVYTRPIYLTRIEDKNGSLIHQFVPETREAINEETAYIMLHMLKGATEEPGGTARGLDMELRINNEIGAKTGTTQNASDGWFMGVTQDLVAGAWVGGDERSIHFRNWYMGSGARTAMPIWEKFMKKVYNDPSLPYKKKKFEKPIRDLSIEINCENYKSYNQKDSLNIEPDGFL